MRVFAVAMQKGGVGKTTLAANLAVCVADLGHRVLVVDADPQCHQSLAFGIKPAGASLCEVLLDGLPARDAIVPVRNLSLLPGSPRLASADLYLAREPDGNHRLRSALAAIADELDYVFIDCPPTLGTLTLNALVAADRPLVPIQTEQAAANSFPAFYTTFQKVKAHLNPSIEEPLLIPTMFMENTSHHREILLYLQRNPLHLEVSVPVKRRIRITEALHLGLPVCEIDRDASAPFERIAQQLVETPR